MTMALLRELRLIGTARTQEFFYGKTLRNAVFDADFASRRRRFVQDTPQ